MSNGNLPPLIILGGGPRRPLNLQEACVPLASGVCDQLSQGRKLGAPVSVNGLIYPKVHRVSETWRAYLLGENPITFEVP